MHELVYWFIGFWLIAFIFSMKSLVLSVQLVREDAQLAPMVASSVVQTLLIRNTAIILGYPLILASGMGAAVVGAGLTGELFSGLIVSAVAAVLSVTIMFLILQTVCSACRFWIDYLVRFFWSLGRRPRIRNAADAQNYCEGNIALYLRPWGSDGAVRTVYRPQSFRKSEISDKILFNWASLGGAEFVSLNEIVERTAKYRNLKFRSVGGNFLSFGGSRASVPDSNWKQLVSEMMDKARVIFILPSPNPGTMWELNRIKEENLYPKTVFLFPPESAIYPLDRIFGPARRADFKRRMAKAIQIFQVDPPNLPGAYRLVRDGKSQNWELLGDWNLIDYSVDGLFAIPLADLGRLTNVPRTEH